MIQRIQSIWLLLVAIFAAVTFRFPFYTGERLVDGLPAVTDLDALTTIWLTVLTALAGGVAFVNIFLFSNRKLQLKLCYFGILLTVLLLVMYFLEIGNFTRGSIALWCLFHFAMLAFYILAARGIWNDEKLIKSMDRLR
ncbi:MAG TPA: DUF4293 domain-containing protein [Flavisolibacter sp.]|nr:DUF4293 domain-containing protein [Flavisolibacter sp.]